jgi:hypothetical protein
VERFLVERFLAPFLPDRFLADFFAPFFLPERFLVDFLAAFRRFLAIGCGSFRSSARHTIGLSAGALTSGERHPQTKDNGCQVRERLHSGGDCRQAIVKQRIMQAFARALNQVLTGRVKSNHGKIDFSRKIFSDRESARHRDGSQ